MNVQQNEIKHIISPAHFYQYFIDSVHELTTESKSSIGLHWKPFFIDFQIQIVINLNG